jgi:hypothetical protein
MPSVNSGVAYISRVAGKYNYSSLYLVEKPETIVEPQYEFMSDEYNVLITFHHGVRTYYGIDCAAYLSMKSSFLQSLRPLPSILQTVNNVYNEHFRDGVLMVGVHVRDHDPAFDWPVVPPLNSGGTGRGVNAANFGVGATTGHFLRIMHSMNGHFNGSVGDNTGGSSILKFFLASNSNSVKEQIMNSLPNVISMRVGDHDRNSSDSIRQGLIDLLLLSRSSLLLHTFASTFAIEASVWNNTPIFGIIEGVLIQHHDTSMPFCGIPLYAAAFNTLPMRRAVYSENIAVVGGEDRVVSSPAAAYGVCQSMQSDWGFPDDVWCMSLANPATNVTV